MHSLLLRLQLLNAVLHYVGESIIHRLSFFDVHEGRDELCNVDSLELGCLENAKSLLWLFLDQH